LKDSDDDSTTIIDIMKLTTIQVNIQLADEAAKALGVKSRTEAARLALREIVGPRKYKHSAKKRKR